MATEIGAIAGLIELKDEFSQQLGLTQAVLGNFSKHTQESLTAVVEAGGLVTAALLAASAAVLELGKHGTNVNDVRDTLDRFSGSAQVADANLKALRDGVQGTVDDLTLMKDASHLLSANVKLSSEEFGLLGEATLALQRRGLHGTVEMMDLVSDALINGKTKGLEAELGILNLDVAEQKFARNLGITVDQLSDAGKVEAHRTAIMQKMREVVQDTGVTERNFAEQVEAGRAKLENFTNELASAVAKSPAFAAGMKVVEDAVQAAFGENQAETIGTLVHFLENTVIATTYVGTAAVEAARVFHVAWSAVKVAILGTETVVMSLADMFLSAFTEVANAIALVTNDEQVKKQAATIAATRDQVRGMADDLSKQTAEAMAGVVGQSAFDKTLDKVGGTLMRVRDAMNAAQTASEKHTEAIDKHEASTKKNTETQAQFNARMIDQQKIQEQLKKSTAELAVIWDDYFALVAKNSGTSQQAQRAQIQATFDKQVAALNDLDPLYKAKYDAYKAIADESLEHIGSSWDSLRDKSIEGLQEQANSALADYEKMLAGGLHFSRDVLDAQLQKYHDLQDAARGFGNDAVSAHSAAAEAAKKQSEELERQKAKVDELAAANRAMGGSFTYDLSTREGIEQYRKMNPAASITWSDEQVMAYAKKGGNLQGLIATGVINPYAGMGAVPSFREGTEGEDFGAGTVAILHGKERITPLDDAGNPKGKSKGSGSDQGMTLVQNYYVNGTGEQVYKFIRDRQMRDLKQSRKFGSA